MNSADTFINEVNVDQQDRRYCGLSGSDVVLSGPTVGEDCHCDQQQQQVDTHVHSHSYIGTNIMDFESLVNTSLFYTHECCYNVL